MAGNVWVVAEQWKGSISDATYEALALGRELAAGLGARLEAVLAGHGARPWRPRWAGPTASSASSIRRWPTAPASRSAGQWRPWRPRGRPP